MMCFSLRQSAPSSSARVFPILRDNEEIYDSTKVFFVRFLVAQEHLGYQETREKSE
jgi:hypothetical protein